jgi:hypothetical protein
MWCRRWVHFLVLASRVNSPRSSPPPTGASEVLLVTRIRALSEARRKAAEGDPDARLRDEAELA